MLASTPLLQVHCYMLEIKSMTSLDFWGRMGIGVGTVRASAGVCVPLRATLPSLF